MSIHSRGGGGGEVNGLIQNCFATYVCHMHWGYLSGCVCHFDMYTASGEMVFVKGSPSSARLPMHRHAYCTDLHIKKEILHRTITGTECVFIQRLRLPQSSPTWTTSKGFIKLTDSLLDGLSLKQRWECVWKIHRSYPQQCYGVKCTWRCVCVCVCVCAHTRVWASV